MKKRTHEPKAIDEGVLFEAIKDNMSPHAVAAIAAYFDTATSTVGCNNPTVSSQVAWFAQRLRESVGGDEAFDRLCDQIGL